MTLRRTLLALSLAVAVPALAFGPPPGPPEALDPAEAADRMAEHLELDDATRDAIEGILADTMEANAPRHEALKEAMKALAEVRDADVPDPKATRRLVRDIADLRVELTLSRFEAEDAVHALLTPEQLEQVKLHRAKKRAVMADRMRHALHDGF